MSQQEFFPEQPLPFGVEPISGEPLRFHVFSRSKPGHKWLVDLEEVGFNGWCGCQNFEFAHMPKIRDDIKNDKPLRRRRCFHIKRALEYRVEVENRIVARRMAGREP